MKNEILKDFTSGTFRNCISEHYDELTAEQKHSIIASGKVDLTQKLEDMKKLRDSFADEEKNSDVYKNVLGNIADYERLVSYMTTPKPGTVFIKSVCSYDRDSPMCTDQEGWAKPFASFESVMKSIHEQAQDLKYNYFNYLKPDGTWFFIRQFELEDGEYKLVAQYIVLFDGTVVDGRLEREKMCGFYWMSVLVPTPFKVGDIIHIDFRPFRRPFNAVIIRKESFENGYDRCVDGFCSPMIMFIDEYGCLICDTLADLNYDDFNISPVSLAKLSVGEVRYKDNIINNISRFIRENKNGAEIIERYCTDKNEKGGNVLNADEIRKLIE